ncbi:unnamed protein product [Urochloa decumbens]|uniref:Transcription repressor n=1 Tax=Urochloa decumbens TaxID=240449 RepID=A0ABC8VTF8_9POAL
MQSMDCGSRSGGGRRRLKDRLAQLLRPAANSLLRSPCSSSSSTSATALTATAGATTTTTATISTSSTSTTAANYTTVTGALQLIPRAEPFSAALDRLRHPPPPPPERTRGGSIRDGMSAASSRHGSRRRRCRSMNTVVDKVGGGIIMALSSNPYGFTSSGSEEDADDDTDADGCYGEDDTEAFLSSSRSQLPMSSDSSSGFYKSSRNPLPATDKNHRHHRQRRRRRRCRRPSASCVAEACGAGAVREPGFRPLVAATTTRAAAEQQVRRGLAVVKRSRDPYGDFRESMVEMIVGRQVFGAAELERLLASYLSLNAPRFHPVILQAFSDIWVVLHGGGG